MASYGISDWRKLGAVLRDARRRQQLSQEELAAQAGVSRAWLAKLESGGHRRAEIEQVFKLLSALSLELVVRDRQRSAEESTILTALEDALRADPGVSTSSVIRGWARASAPSPPAAAANQSTDDRAERDAAADASERPEREQVNASSAGAAEMSSAGARRSRRAQIAAERRAALARDSEGKRARELARSQTSAHTSTRSSAAERRPGPDSR